MGNAEANANATGVLKWFLNFAAKHMISKSDMKHRTSRCPPGAPWPVPSADRACRRSYASETASACAGQRRQHVRLVKFGRRFFWQLSYPHRALRVQGKRPPDHQSPTLASCLPGAGGPHRSRESPERSPRNVLAHEPKLQASPGYYPLRCAKLKHLSGATLSNR